MVDGRNQIKLALIGRVRPMELVDTPLPDLEDAQVVVPAPGPGPGAQRSEAHSHTETMGRDVGTQ